MLLPQEKVGEAKKLASSILSMKHEMQRMQEQLQECERYAFMLFSCGK